MLAFLTDADLLPRGRVARNQLFLQELGRTEIARSRLALSASGVEARVTSATSTIRQIIGGNGWVALGDAAATYDPLMGLGVPAALAKGLAFARLMLSNPIGSAISRYIEEERICFNEFLRARQEVYGVEERWPNSRFWQRRRI